MTSELRVKKQPVPASVFMSDGTTLSGTIFLSPVGPRHQGRETVPELMDEPEELIPFRTQSDRFILLGKPGIVAFRLLSGESKPDIDTQVPADVKLNGGFQFGGNIISEASTDRLSDVLNHADDWIRLVAPNGVIWLRRRAILTASQTGV